MTLDGTVEMLHSKIDSDYIAKKNHSLHQILYHACTAVDVCCVCVSFFYPMSFVRLPWTWLMCKMDILPYTAVSRKVTWIKA